MSCSRPPLDRPHATHAARIPIKKSEAWWKLTQDERRLIFEERSHHLTIGLRYLPEIARRLYHYHDLGEAFDFLTWFEYAPADGEAFEELVGILRQTEGWTYVEREIDIHLVADPPSRVYYHEQISIAASDQEHDRRSFQPIRKVLTSLSMVWFPSHSWCRVHVMRQNNHVQDPFLT